MSDTLKDFMSQRGIPEEVIKKMEEEKVFTPNIYLSLHVRGAVNKFLQQACIISKMWALKSNTVYFKFKPLSLWIHVCQFYCECTLACTMAIAQVLCTADNVWKIDVMRWNEKIMVSGRFE